VAWDVELQSKWQVHPSTPTITSPTANLRLQPLLAIQNNLEPQDIPVGMSLVMVCQSLGAALFLSFAQTIFSNSLAHELPIDAPGVNVEAVIKAGASTFRAVIPKAFLPGVLMAYDRATNDVFYLAAGAGVGAFVVCWGMGWKSVKKAKIEKPEVEKV
jgi:hypothetical protein